MYLQIIFQRTIRDMINYHRTRFMVKYAAYQISGSIQLNHYKNFPYAFRNKQEIIIIVDSTPDT